MKLIDINAIKLPEGFFEKVDNVPKFYDWINSLPTIDAEPVRHGKWIFSPGHAEGACTLCNFKIYGRPYNNTYLIVPYNYCPNCGAKMDGGAN